MKLTKHQHRAIQAWLDEAVTILRLQQWTITLQREIDDDPDAWASIQPDTGSHWCTLRIHRPFVEGCTAKGRQHTLTHELCHLLVHDMEIAALGLMDPLSPKQKDQWEHALETTVDGLADRLVPQMPKAPKV